MDALKSEARVIISRAEPSGTSAQERASEGQSASLRVEEEVASRVLDKSSSGWDYRLE